MRWLGIVALVVIVGLVVGLSSYLGPDDLRKCSSAPSEVANCQSADAIIAVSGGDTNARTDEAIRLYKSGWAPTIVFSGAALDTTGPSNAEAMRQRAINQKVPDSAIIVEKYSRNTAENALNTSTSVSNLGYTRVILVTSAYHQRRASLEFHRRLGENVTIVNHPTQNDNQWGQYWWMSLRGWWLATSELVKILFFYAGSEVFNL